MPLCSTGLAPPAFTAPCRNQTDDCTPLKAIGVPCGIPQTRRTSEQRTGFGERFCRGSYKSVTEIGLAGLKTCTTTVVVRDFSPAYPAVVALDFSPVHPARLSPATQAADPSPRRAWGAGGRAPTETAGRRATESRVQGRSRRCRPRSPGRTDQCTCTRPARSG